MTRALVRTVAALTLGLATAAVGLPAGAAAPTSSASAMTRIVLKVKHCDGCTIGTQRALDSDTSVRPRHPRYWTGPSGTVRHGRVVLLVPTARTSGLSFTIDAPWADNVTDAATNVVLGYPGRPARTPVSKHAARHAGVATACWAGTARDTIRIKIRVAKVRGPILGGGGRGVTPIAWANPTAHTVPGTATSTWKGTLGNQDAYYC